MMRRALMLCLFAACATPESSLASDRDASLYQLHEKLLSQDGKAIDLDVYRGKPVLVTMFYATCPATCPLIIDTLRAVERKLDERASRVLKLIGEINQGERGPTTAEYSATLTDVAMMMYLGQYYAAKIRGATELALFRKTRAPEHQKKAVEHLRAAQQHWSSYSDRSGHQYRNPLWTNRVGVVDWRELSDEVANDVAIASQPLKAR